MLTNNSLLNTAFNQIHRWNKPEQHPLTRIFLTRLSEIVCAVIEVSSIIFKMFEFIGLNAKQFIRISSKLVVTIFPKKMLQNYSPSSSLFPQIQSKGIEICKLVAGLTCTIFLGMIFSPEANFKIHLKLHLVVDNLAEKTQRELNAKLEREQQKAEIIQERAERFAKLEAAHQEAIQTGTEVDVINSRLAELLFPLPN